MLRRSRRRVLEQLKLIISGIADRVSTEILFGINNGREELNRRSSLYSGTHWMLIYDLFVKGINEFIDSSFEEITNYQKHHTVILKKKEWVHIEMLLNKYADSLIGIFDRTETETSQRFGLEILSVNSVRMMNNAHRIKEKIMTNMGKDVYDIKIKLREGRIKFVTFISLIVGLFVTFISLIVGLFVAIITFYKFFKN